MPCLGASAREGEATSLAWLATKALPARGVSSLSDSLSLSLSTLSLGCNQFSEIWRGALSHLRRTIHSSRVRPGQDVLTIAPCRRARAPPTVPTSTSSAHGDGHELE